MPYIDGLKSVFVLTKTEIEKILSDAICNIKPFFQAHTEAQLILSINDTDNA